MYTIKLEIIEYVRNCGFSPDDWDIKALAEEIYHGLGYASLDDISDESISEIFPRYAVLMD